jgi:hypothetical protein
VKGKALPIHAGIISKSMTLFVDEPHPNACRMRRGDAGPRGGALAVVRFSLILSFVGQTKERMKNYFNS